MTLGMGMAWYLVFVLSVTAHEAAHAFAALKLGDPTAYHGGQVTLDPVPHIMRSPFGMVLVPILSFAFNGWMMGWASAPYDPFWADRYPKRAAWMGLAGPGANLLLVLISAILIRTGMLAGVFQLPQTISFDSIVSTESVGLFRGLAIMLSICFSLNILLMVFNLMPFPPLDGVALVEFVASPAAASKYRQFCMNPGVMIFGIFIAWNVMDVVFPSVVNLAIKLLYTGV